MLMTYQINYLKFSNVILKVRVTKAFLRHEKKALTN